MSDRAGVWQFTSNMDKKVGMAAALAFLLGVIFKAIMPLWVWCALIGAAVIYVGYKIIRWY